MQEMYWAADGAGLTDVMPPLLDFIARLARSGETTARDLYGSSGGGWVAHGFTDNRLATGTTQ
jgi:alpha-L-fucosidase 2